MSAEAPNLDRNQEATQLIDDFELRKDAEFFSDTANRLNFLKALDFEDFSGILQHVNARVRGYEPRDQVNAHDEGSFLPGLKTPESEDKSQVLSDGFNVIKRYLNESADSNEQKIKGAGMAVEALIIWTHPFNDGNGRTSRFMGKFIEDGVVDTDRLIAETTDLLERMRMYPEYLRLDDTIDLKRIDLMLDDDEIESIEKAQAKLPVTEGIPLSIRRLLEDKTLQERVEADTQMHKDNRRRALENASQAA